MKRIALKLSLMFTVMITIASVLSFASAVFLTPGLRTEMRRNQDVLVDTLLELSQKTALSPQEMGEIVSNFMYDVHVVDASELPDMDSVEAVPLENGALRLNTQGKFGSTRTYLLLEEGTLLIRLQPHNTMLKMTASRNWYAFISFVLIGAVLMTMAAQRIVKPVLRLTEATREISKGNFDIQVDYAGDDEIGQLTDHFNTMARELRHIDTLRRDFISNVSHEFKTPIASIQGFSKLLQQNTLTVDERKEYLNIISEESNRLSHLSDNMIRLSKLESQEIVHRSESFLLDEQIRKCILLLQPEWEGKSLQWEIDLDRARISGDEELLQQVWINLLTNAIKFSHSDGVILVQLKHTREGVCVNVTDKGIGMSEEVQSRIFEKFYQGDASHAAQGSGLGLALVKRILDLHQGSIHVSSVLNEGTVIHVDLPVTPL